MIYRISQLLPVTGLLLLCAYAVFSLHRLAAPSPLTAFTGGRFEASGVSHVPGTESILFVDDGRPAEIFWMQLDKHGNQAGAIKPIQLGTSVIDLEGITTDGAYYYVIGSQSKAKGLEQAGLVRFTFDAQAQQTRQVEAISGLKRWLAANVTELQGMGNRSYKEGGINIEGLAWDPEGKRLLLGLRSPIINEKALVIPLRLRDASGNFSPTNLEAGQAIHLPLRGAGIRSLEYNHSAKVFHLLTGAAQNNENTDFRMWEWDGQAQQPVLLETNTFAAQLKPEGITPLPTSNRIALFLVFDTSGYVVMN